MWDALPWLDLTRSELKVWAKIVRLTKGWKKDVDGISLNQLSEATGILNRNIPRVIEQLKARQMIEVGTITKKTNKGPRQFNAYRPNWDYRSWKKGTMTFGEWQSFVLKIEGGKRLDSTLNGESNKMGFHSQPRDDSTLTGESIYRPQDRIPQDKKKKDEPSPSSSHKKKGNTEMRSEIPYREIIDYLNEKSGKDFKLSDRIIKLINDRIDEGAHLGDFKKVIRIKSLKWREDPKGNEWLRPSTLFGEDHFQEYLNEREDLIEEDSADRIIREVENITRKRGEPPAEA